MALNICGRSRIDVTGAFLVTCCREARMYPGAIYALALRQNQDYVLSSALFIEEEVQDLSIRITGIQVVFYSHKCGHRKWKYPRQMHTLSTHCRCLTDLQVHPSEALESQIGPWTPCIDSCKSSTVTMWWWQGRDATGFWVTLRRFFPKRVSTHVNWWKL